MPATDTRPSLITLTDLPAGRCGVIAALDLEPAATDRLAGLGICVGREIELIQRGDPLIIRACGARIGLAGELARGVRIHACTLACPASSTRTTPDTLSEP